MKRIKRGWALTKKSWGMIKAHPALIRFPLYGGIATTLLAIVTLGPGFFFMEEDQLGVGIPIVVVGIYVLTVVGVFFGVGLAAAADRIFRGQEASVGDGLAVARARLGAICGWALLSTAISLVIGLLEDQGGIFGTIAARLVGMAWSLVTFVAVPVIAIEGTGPFATLKRSASIFRERWGEQITGNVAIGGGVLLIGLLPAALLIAGGIAIWSTASFIGALLVVVGVLVLAIALLISKALSGIFGVALFRYATQGEAVGGYTIEELESAIRVKGDRGSPRGATPGTV